MSPEIAMLPLRDLLKRERVLAPLEVHALLARSLKAIEQSARGEMSPLLDRLCIECELPAGMAASVLQEPVRFWPKADLRATEAGRGGEIAGDATISPRALRGMKPATALATLVHALLGGPVLGNGLPSRAPLACLNEEANGALHQGLAGRQESCADFWNAWSGALDPRERVTPVGMMEWVVPEPLAHLIPATDEVVDLEPALETGRTIRLISRSDVRIGRSRSRSDLPIHAFSGGHYDDARTERISRIHATLSWRGAGFLDGDGLRPSVNGSIYNGHMLGLTEPVPIGSGGLLQLGTDAEVEVMLESIKPWWRFPILGLPTSQPTGGAIRFEVLGEVEALRETIALGGAVGFNVRADGSIRWSSHPTEAASWLIRRADGFWLGVLHAPGQPVAVDSVVLQPGEIAPLAAGSVLHFGEQARYVRPPA